MRTRLHQAKGHIKHDKKSRYGDADVLASLAIQMWTDNDSDELTEEFRQLTEKEDAACFIKYIGNKPVAFAQCQLRHDYVEGTDSSAVGYLEGIFVSEGYRRKGYAAELDARFSDLQRRYCALFINNETEFSYIGFKSRDDEDAFHADILDAIRELKEKLGGRYEIVDDINK